MKIYAICLVKNEDDIIGQTLVHATRYCDSIFVIDNGSTDSTWQVVHDVAAKYRQVVPFTQLREPFDNGMRWFAYEAHHKELSDNDWWLILDGDEFLAEDPRPVIEAAMRQGADIIEAWQIQFYYTEKDREEWLAGRDSRDSSIFARRRYYRIDWQEPRLFRNQTEPNVIFRQSVLLTDSSPWGASVKRIKGKVCRRRVFNRHFQYRDPPQIAKRLELRLGRREFESQVKSADWQSVVRRSKRLTYHRDGDRWYFSCAGLAHHYKGWVRYFLLRRCGVVGEWFVRRTGF